MMDHSSMAITRNNGGGIKSQLPPSLQYGSAYRKAYFYNPSSGDPNDDAFPIVIFVITGVLVLLRLFCYGLRKDAEEQEAGGGDRLGQRRPLPSSRAGGLADRDNPSTTVAAVEMAAEPEPEPPVVCTYRKEDGWGEDSCGVCLAELADGEVLRVLPACLHFFHAACVNEWLRRHDTCPLCRAPLVAPGDAT